MRAITILTCKLHIRILGRDIRIAKLMRMRKEAIVIECILRKTKNIERISKNLTMWVKEVQETM